jgi:hypothetical protein
VLGRQVRGPRTSSRHTRRAAGVEHLAGPVQDVDALGLDVALRGGDAVDGRDLLDQRRRGRTTRCRPGCSNPASKAVARVTLTSLEVLSNRLVKVRLSVSVKIIVPETKATPRTMASPDRASRSLCASRPRRVARHMSGLHRGPGAVERLHALEHPLGGRVGHLVDDAAVGEEQTRSEYDAAAGSCVTITTV